MPGARFFVVRATHLLVSLFIGHSVLAAQFAISVVDRHGKPVPHAYIGVVRENDVWRSPVAERIAAEGTAQFDVAGASLRVVAGAPGYGTHFGEPVRPGATRIVLEPLGSVAGQIVDPENRPVANARVASYFDRLPDHPRRLSPLGTKHLSANRLALSDVDGLFELRVPMTGPTPVLIEADRMSPVVVDEVTAGSDRLSRIVLQRGASLSIDGEHGPLELIPIATSLPPSLPVHRATHLWRRPEGGAWLSLPPGTYDIATRVSSAETPVTLSRVTLAAGDARTVTLPAVASALKNDARLMLDRRVPGTIAVTRWRGGGPSPVTAKQDGLALTIPGCAADDRYVVATKQRVGFARVAGCNEITTVQMHDRAELRVRFETEEIAGGIVRAATCDGKTTRAEIPFTALRGVANMPLPAGCSSLSVSARPYATTNLGTANVAAGARHEAVVKTLQRAAALLVRVLHADGRPAAVARVVAVPPEALRDVRNVEALGKVSPIADGKAAQDGWIRFPDLPNEPIQLLVFTPEGRVANLTPAFLLTRGAERMEQVVLDTPGSVHVQTVRDGDSAAVQLLHVTLRPGQDSPWPRMMELRAPAGTDGAASFDAVPPGSWVASAIARLPRGSTLSVGKAEVFVPPGGWITASVSIADSVYRGKITGGDVPDGAVLSLQGAEGSRSADQFTTIVDRRFEVLLENPGTFRASIQRQDGARIVAPRPVVFDSADREVEIILGQGKITGIVENTRGEPLSKVTVEAHGEGEARARSNEQGVFTLDALPAGKWQIFARSENERSDTADVIVGDTPLTGFRLVMRERRVIRGTLHHGNGTPVADAAVFVVPLTPPGAEALIAQTDEQGRFELKDPPPPQMPFAANVMVGLTLQHSFVRLMEVRDNLALQVPAFGTALLRRSDQRWSSESMRNHVLVAPDGAWVSPANVGRAQGGQTLVVRLVPGVWRYVILKTPADRHALRSGNGLALAPLTTFVVDENKPVEVELQLGEPGSGGER
ncbi:MAG TPA: carboxypeptidase-like regulatory domain-containing protein [Thermoanaerobaculia bacterium]